jgi:primosomal protein N' (replication factor Y)
MVALAVLVDTPQHSTVRGALSYAAEQSLPVGTLVQVPLGRRTVCGIVWHDDVGPTEAGVELRPVAATLAGAARAARLD